MPLAQCYAYIKGDPSQAPCGIVPDLYSMLMERIDPLQIASILLSAPAWAKIAMTMPEENMRVQGASELAITIVEQLSGYPYQQDRNQLSLPL